MGVRLSGCVIDSFYFASFFFIFCMNVIIYRALLKQTRKGGHMNSPNLLALSDCLCGENASFVFFSFSSAMGLLHIWASTCQSSEV